ncbi:hypothetical protein B0H13DRAFT_933518 [Mycena leptocephala]|nr:hypothetical protein B0H13DRAFT_933518 [Mycena leptocephala]
MLMISMHHCAGLGDSPSRKMEFFESNSSCTPSNETTTVFFRASTYYSSPRHCILLGYYTRENELHRLAPSTVFSADFLLHSIRHPLSVWDFSGRRDPDALPLACGAARLVQGPPRGGVKRIWVNRNLRTLPDVYDRRMAACGKLEGAETKLLSIAAKAHLKAGGAAKDAEGRGGGAGGTKGGPPHAQARLPRPIRGEGRLDRMGAGGDCRVQ